MDIAADVILDRDVVGHLHVLAISGFGYRVELRLSIPTLLHLWDISDGCLNLVLVEVALELGLKALTLGRKDFPTSLRCNAGLRTAIDLLFVFLFLVR